MGCDQREQPLRSKEVVEPTVMVRAAASAPASLTATQDAAQPHADPGIQDLEREAMTVLKVRKPASQRAVHARDDDRQALSLGPPSFTPNRVFELPQAFRARPLTPRLEVISQKVKAADLRGVHDPRLRGMQRQSRRGRPDLHRGQCRAGFRLAAAEKHEVVGVANHLVALLCHLLVERVEIDIGQQRTDDGLNAKDNFQFERAVRYRLEGRRA